MKNFKLLFFINILCGWGLSFGGAPLPHDVNNPFLSATEKTELLRRQKAFEYLTRYTLSKEEVDKCLVPFDESSFEEIIFDIMHGFLYRVEQDYDRILKPELIRVFPDVDVQRFAMFSVVMNKFYKVFRHYNRVFIITTRRTLERKKAMHVISFNLNYDVLTVTKKWLQCLLDTCVSYDFDFEFNEPAREFMIYFFYNLKQVIDCLKERIDNKDFCSLIDDCDRLVEEIARLGGKNFKSDIDLRNEEHERYIEEKEKESVRYIAESEEIKKEREEIEKETARIRAEREERLKNKSWYERLPYINFKATKKNYLCGFLIGSCIGASCAVSFKLCQPMLQNCVLPKSKEALLFLGTLLYNDIKQDNDADPSESLEPSDSAPSADKETLADNDNEIA